MLNELVFSNIKKSISHIETNPSKVNDSLITINNDKKKSISSELFFLIAKEPLQNEPWFFLNNRNEINSPQTDFFGFYALKNIIRGVLMAVNFLDSGNILEQNKFVSSSISMFYSASYHLLYSFLALNGRVIIDNSKGPIVIDFGETSSSMGHDVNFPYDVVVAKLTHSNKWKFENRPRNHSSKWRDLAEVFNNNNFALPEYFKKYFSYSNHYGPYTKYNENEKKYYEYLLEDITQIRHNANYGNYGFDDFAFDSIINRDGEYYNALNLKVSYFKTFTNDFFDDVLDKSLYLIDNLDLNETTNKNLRSSILYPPLEFYNFSEHTRADIKDKITKLILWVYFDKEYKKNV